MTPISDLFEEQAAATRITSLSNSLEARPDLSLPNVSWEKVTHVHFSDPSMDAHLPWGVAQKEIVRKAITKSGSLLDALSFHVSRDFLDSPLDNAGLYLPGLVAISKDEMQSNCEANFTWLRNFFGGQILIENNNFFSTGAYEIVTDSMFIQSMVNNHADGLLFDLAHAAVASHNKDVAFEEYVAPLVGTTVGQIHLSRWTVDSNGIARDSHELPGGREFEILGRIFSSGFLASVPLTIEYYKQSEVLADLLGELQDA